MRLISWNRLLRKNCRVEHATKFAFLFRRIQVFLLIDTSAFLGKKPVSQEVELGENPTTFSATPIKKRCRLSCPTLWRFHAEYSAFYSLAFLTFPQKPKKIIHSGLRSATPIKKRCRLSCPTLWRFHAEYSAFYSLAFLTFPQKPKKIIHSGLRSAAIHPVYSRQNQRCFVIWNPLPVVHPDRFWLECSFVLSSKSSESSFSHKPEKGFHPNQSLPFVIWNPLPVVHPDRFWLECSFVLSSKSSESSFSHKPEKGFHPNQSLPFPICVFGLSMLPTSENYLIVYSQEICLFVGLSLCDYKIS